MIKIKLNSLIFPYFISLYNSIHDFDRSTALGIGALAYRPTRNSAKAGFYAFSTSKKSSFAVCETVLVSINH